IDFCDLRGAEEDAVKSVAVERTDCERFAHEGFRHAPEPAFEGEVSLGGIDATHDLAAVVDRVRQPVREGAWRRAIAAGRYRHADALMRTGMVVDVSPAG